MLETLYNTTASGNKIRGDEGGNVEGKTGRYK